MEYLKERQKMMELISQQLIHENLASSLEDAKKKAEEMLSSAYEDLAI